MGGINRTRHKQRRVGEEYNVRDDKQGPLLGGGREEVKHGPRLVKRQIKISQKDKLLH